MLFGFPAPRPDELLYSVIARYGQYLGLTGSQRALVQHVFGRRGGRSSVLFPSGLSQLQQRLPPGHPLRGDAIARHTLAPLFQPFTEWRRYQGQHALLKDWEKRGVHLSLSTSAFGSGVSHLRACESCFYEDVAETGEAVWRRIHQSPTALLCPRHAESVLRTEIPISGSKNRHRWFPLSRDLIDEAVPVFLPSSENESVALELARTTQWILNSEVKPQSQARLTKRYRAVARKLDWVYPDGRLMKLELSRRATDYFGDEILSCVGVQNENWAVKCLENPKRPTHHIRHLLLLTFLGVDLDDFFSRLPSDSLSPQASSAAPSHHRDGPCMNMFCSSFGGEVREVLSETFQTMVEVRCPNCGFSYQVFRKGLDLITVRDPGRLWLESVSQMRHEGATWVEVERATGLTGYMVRKIRGRFPDQLPD